MRTDRSQQHPWRMTSIIHDSMRLPSRMLCLAAHGTHLTTIPMHSQPYERLEAPDGPASEPAQAPRAARRVARRHKQPSPRLPCGPPPPAHALLRSSLLLVNLFLLACLAPRLCLALAFSAIIPR